ncbi:hypothetical protein Gpo141_00014119 [Globisporangium polare]
MAAAPRPLDSPPHSSPSPALTSVTALLRHAPQLQSLPHVASAVHAFLDRSVLLSSVASAVSFSSVELLKRVARHEQARWRRLKRSNQRIAAYKAQHFQDAMMAIAAMDDDSISVDVVEWLFDEYCPVDHYVPEDFVGVSVFKSAACASHAVLLTWLSERLARRPRLDWKVLRTVVERGHVAVLQWWVTYNDPNAFTALELDLAAGHGNLEVVKLMFSYAADPSKPRYTIRGIENAGWNGHVHVVKWLYEHCEWQLPGFAPQAMRGSFEVATYLYERRPQEAVFDVLLLQSAVASGDLAFVEWVVAHSKETFAMKTHLSSTIELLAMKNHWAMLRWLHARSPLSIDTPTVFRGAVTSGSLVTIQWLYENYPEAWQAAKSLALDKAAAASGRVEMVQWLHEKEYPITVAALNIAAACGHWSVVKWLHENGKLPDVTTRAMDEAAFGGHFEVVQFLHENRTEGCTAAAMDHAAAQGRLDIVTFLHEHRNQAGCTRRAMNQAARFGHLEVVTFLHTNRDEDCSTLAMDCASSVEVLDFLHQNRTEGCTTRAYVEAAKRGDLKVLDWLYEHKPELMDLAQITNAAAGAESRKCVLLWVGAIQLEQSGGE